MRPHHEDERVTLWHGDCLEVLRSLPDASVDSVVTDPPYNLSFMAREWDSHVSAVAFQQWCEPWATECLRVLKPGGMIAAFGGTRTFHRLACAIEDAGFEIRDSIGYGTEERPGLMAWAYGSGFPKSLNVTKALEALPTCSCSVASLSGEPAPVVEASSPPSSIGARAGAEAGAMSSARSTADEAVGVGPQVVASRAPDGGVSDVDALDVDGIGQALPVVLRPSPVAGAAEGQEVVGPVGNVEVKPEALRDQVMGEQSVDPTTVGTPPVTLDDGGSDVRPASPLVFPLAAPPSGVAGTVESVTVVDGHAGAGAVDASVGPAAELISTDGADVDAVSLTLHASHSTPERMVRCEACGGVRGPIPQGLGTALKPAWEPIVLARKPLSGTVAQTVLEHGTGALNIDACRVGMSDVERAVVDKRSGAGSSSDGWGNIGQYEEGRRFTSNPSGRWPANVLLDDSQAAELDRQSGETTGKVGMTQHASNGPDAILGERRRTSQSTVNDGITDRGGASRFFPTFRYEAKAPQSERPKVNGTTHPTVKPLDLMRWLVRLVTPPGGTVLEPFAGSGTTVEAAIVEGFHCIAIEREADYLPLIMQRINRHLDPVAAIKQTGDDLGLFDLEGEGA